METVLCVSLQCHRQSGKRYMSRPRDPEYRSGSVGAKMTVRGRSSDETTNGRAIQGPLVGRMALLFVVSGQGSNKSNTNTHKIVVSFLLLYIETIEFEKAPAKGCGIATSARG